jgi:unsaturated rhamnogalacturonyl hydrolase
LKCVGKILTVSLSLVLPLTLAWGQNGRKHQTVLLDYYFNSEVKKDPTGQLVPWHYKWDEMPNSGFSLWANVFRGFGVQPKALTQAPTTGNLKHTDIYIIVDPDNEKENEHPNFIEQSHIIAISDWVKAGGVLVLMGNDAGNAEFDHFNQLAKQFGIQFNMNSRNRVQGNNFATGKIMVEDGHPIFKTARQLFLKEISTLSLDPPAQPVLMDNGDVIMALSKVGRGTVFAVGDPWLYNEYIDSRRLPAEFDNYRAAQDLTRWLLKQTTSRSFRRHPKVGTRSI